MYRDYKNFRLDSFLSDLESQNWNEVENSSTLDSKIEIFNDKLLNALNTHAPMKEANIRHVRATPWVDSELKNLMKARDKARRIWKSRKTSITLKIFKSLRKEVNVRFRSAEISYYNKIFSKVKSSDKIWSQLKKIGLTKDKNFAAPLAVNAEDLNSYFTDISISTSLSSPDSFNFEISMENTEKFRFTEPDLEEIYEYLKSTTSTSVGIDNISSSILKSAFPVISNSLKNIFKDSFLLGEFPTLWKQSLIKPIPKIKNPISPSDYRPISLLCATSKLLEKIAATQIMNFLNRNELLDEYQSAYKKNYSTQTALIKLLDSAKLAAEQRKVTIMIFFDFSKAFDRVIHTKLLSILRELNFSDEALLWIASYLTNRKQAIKISENSHSSWKNISYGVPQGSVLGPLLFSVYISFFRNILRCCGYSIYADDITIYLPCNPNMLDEGVSMVNDEIRRIIAWSKKLGLKLNNAKTQAMIVGTSANIQSLDKSKITKISVDGVDIPFKDSVKYLGVNITSDLTWKTEAKTRSKKIFGILQQLKMTRHILPEHLRSKLVSTMIFPVLDYCCAAMSDAKLESDKILQRALNCCVKFIKNANKFEHVTPLYEELQWLKVKTRRKYFICTQIHKTLYTKQPTYLFENLTLRCNTATRSLRLDPLTINIPFCKLDFRKLSFLSLGPTIWNDLPIEIRQITSPTIFKRRLYLHLLDNNES